MIFLSFIAVLFLAFSNGANDNFKGVATLLGSGTLNYKKAIAWATFSTLLGSIASVFFAEVLLKNFSGKGLIDDALLYAPEFAVSVALGAASTVFLATRIGMPISTTHSLVGALSGVGIVASRGDFNFTKLGSTFFVPLLVSPFIALAIAYLLYLVFSSLRLKMGVNKETCVCVGETIECNAQSHSLAMDAKKNVQIKINSSAVCKENYTGNFVGISAVFTLNLLHCLSAGVVSFSRGLNDTPKMAGILLLISTLNSSISILAIAAFIAIGGILNAKKVAETMSEKITKMNDGQGFTANLTTAILVSTASVHGLPASTTHVSVGALTGIGIANKKANWKVIKEIALSWLLTLPSAALLSTMFYLFLKLML